MLVLAGEQVLGVPGVSETVSMKSIWEADVIHLPPCKDMELGALELMTP